MKNDLGLKAALVELYNFQIFTDVKPDVIEALCSGASIVLSAHREMLFEVGTQAKYFGIVLSGAYKLSRPSPSGEDTIVHFSTPGDVLAAFIMGQNNPVYPVTARSMGPSRFLKIPKENYLAAWKTHPDLIIKIQNLLSSRMSQMQISKSLQRAPLSAKIANLLVELVGQHDQGQDGGELPLPLTRKEISDSLGASVESVIRVMSDWSKRGMIQTTDQQIKILKIAEIINEISE